MEAYVIISLLSGVGGATLAFILFILGSRFFPGLRMSQRAQLSRLSIEESEELLKKRGFKISGKQRRADVITHIDGKPNLGFVQADFLVEKKGKMYVAVIKDGEVISDPNEPSTRRKLLEFKFAYKPHGVLLIDTLDRSVHLIDFEFPSYAEDKIFKLILTTLVVIIVLGILWIFMSIKIL
jgi:hypothetical protein